jgi:hypothetical protein
MKSGFGNFIEKKRKVRDVSERVMVYCRQRPRNTTDDDTSDYGSSSSGVTADATVNPIETFDAKSAQVRDLDGKLKHFEFDRFFGPRAPQQEVFDAAAVPVIDSVVEGHHGTIFAYGQTGSGKTHTMLGPAAAGNDAASTGYGGPVAAKAEEEGVIPRALRRLFSKIREQEDRFEFKVTVSYIQIYCEILSDLLQPSNADSLVIRERSGRTNEVYISGASRFAVSSPEECLRHIQVGGGYG